MTTTTSHTTPDTRLIGSSGAAEGEPRSSGKARVCSMSLPLPLWLSGKGSAVLKPPTANGDPRAWRRRRTPPSSGRPRRERDWRFPPARRVSPGFPDNHRPMRQSHSGRSAPSQPSERNRAWGRKCHVTRAKHMAANVTASCSAGGAGAREHRFEGQDAGVGQCSGMSPERSSRSLAGR